MQYGVILPYNTAGSVLRLAQLAEECGWDGIFLGDAIWCEDPLICLAAAAAVTQRIRLGTMLIPAPLRTPWHLSSQALALDRLSNGRLTLGLGTGAVWMGWQSFPDEPAGGQARGEMLEECLDILTLMDQRQPFDYDGKHYHIKLSQMDPVFYPPAAVQQPRIPLWAAGVWPLKQSMARVLKADGVFVEKVDGQKHSQPVTPEDVSQVKAYIEAQRTAARPFDFIVSGKTEGPAPERMAQWQAAGATWWMEGDWGGTEQELSARLRLGPPGAGAGTAF